MTTKYNPIDLTNLSTYSLAGRKSKVAAEAFARPWRAKGSFADFLASLPKILAAEDLLTVVDALVRSFQNGRHVLFGMGAHVIKVGLNPVVIDLMRRGVITGVAMNGAGIIHDLELAMVGRTSEDVAAALGDGSFGMARETGEFLSQAIVEARQEGLGLGEAVGKKIADRNLPHASGSILAEGYRLKIPSTVHVAFGTDIIHMHPQFDPGAAGEASHRDFRILAGLVADLEDGVYMNVGSAVILPEVFLKAMTVARNLGHRIRNLTTVNLDFIRHYRPMTNVVCRPTADGGKGYAIVGHHEILLPLIAAGVVEKIEGKENPKGLSQTEK
ncbi:MAG: hypothetical protein K9K88_15715 [Desulfobacterales bacterium]|nr:hypothetical protein [Desulfobacterales bacterium]